MEAEMLRPSAVALSFTLAALVGIQAGFAQTHQSRPAKSLHARTAAQPNKREIPQAPVQGEKSWMDRASNVSNSGGGGGGM
jgi:hypothetical protein